MYVRGPGIPTGTKSDSLVLNNDLAPTFERIAGLAPPSYTDGRNVLPVWKGSGTSARTAILNERRVKDGNPVSLYQSVITKTQTYVEYTTTAEKELYNRTTDPYELQNSYDPDAPPVDLEARLRALEGCVGDTCRAAEDGP
jgi:arylsulfatase A-like enzyme